LGEGEINKEKHLFKFPSSQPSPAGEGAFLNLMAVTQEHGNEIS